MTLGRTRGEAPAAVRPSPLPEVLPQAGIGRHCGSGYELVLNAIVPQLGRGVVEKPVDTLRLMLTVAALRGPVRGGEDGKERKKRKRRKKKLPKTSSSFLRRGGAWNEGIMHEYVEGDAEDVANKEVSGYSGRVRDGQIHRGESAQGGGHSSSRPDSLP